MAKIEIHAGGGTRSYIYLLQVQKPGQDHLEWSICGPGHGPRLAYKLTKLKQTRGEDTSTKQGLIKHT